MKKFFCSIILTTLLSCPFLTFASPIVTTEGNVRTTIDGNVKTIDIGSNPSDPNNYWISSIKETTNPDTGKIASRQENNYANNKNTTALLTEYRPDGITISSKTTVAYNPTSGRRVSLSTLSYKPDGVTVSSKGTDIYNSAGTVVQKQRETYDTTGKTARETSDYDPTTGKLNSVTVSDIYGGKTTYETISYYKDGVLSYKINTQYDANGNVVSRVRYEGDGKGGLKGNPTHEYQPLSEIILPGGGSVDTSSFPAYLNAIYRIGIGACFALGVIMFTWAGIEYIVSESISSKGDGKKRMTAALTGLAIALVSYILLNTINPDLLKFKSLDVTSNPTTK